ncbi:MAG: type III secretion system export apparatus subunit SctR [Burkholderiaceae bacterium]|jgi:type III secretion protein R
MNNSFFDPILLALTLASLALIPLLVVTGTSFLKISSVLLILRSAIGVQQVPPNLVMYGISFVLTLFVMNPTLNKISESLMSNGKLPANSTALIERAPNIAVPIKEFMGRYIKQDYQDNFFDTAKKFQVKYGGPPVDRSDLAVMLPAFVVSELTAAFQLGLLVFLPFVIIDLVVSCILMALGMMMVSPQTLTLPLKIVLFVAIEGWSKTLQGLVLSYL